MIIEGTISAFERYKTLLETKKAKALDLSDDDPTSLNHLLWMCNTMIKNLKTDPAYPIDKASRWLGFVQGILIAKKLTTVKDERNITRPWFKKAE